MPAPLTTYHFDHTPCSDSTLGGRWVTVLSRGPGTGRHRMAERRPHFLGDGEQRVANDLEADGIDVGGQGTGWNGRGRHGRVMVPQTALP